MTLLGISLVVGVAQTCVAQGRDSTLLGLPFGGTSKFSPLDCDRSPRSKAPCLVVHFEADSLTDMYELGWRRAPVQLRDPEALPKWTDGARVYVMVDRASRILEISLWVNKSRYHEIRESISLRYGPPVKSDSSDDRGEVKWYSANLGEALLSRIDSECLVVFTSKTAVEVRRKANEAFLTREDRRPRAP